jgi:hypothetical protein
MKYAYPRRSRGSSLTGEIVFVAIILIALLAFCAWYSHQVDRMTGAACAQVGDRGCSPFNRTN